MVFMFSDSFYLDVYNNEVEWKDSLMFVDRLSYLCKNLSKYMYIIYIINDLVELLYPVNDGGIKTKIKSVL